MSNLLKINDLKEKVFLQSDSHCFIERENFLNTIQEPTEKSMNFYATTLAELLDNVSTPIYESDIFVGRIVEDFLETSTDFYYLNRTLASTGHLTPNYEKLLKLGYKGILEEIQENQKKINTPESLEYAQNAKTIINAIKRYANRYALEAKKYGNEKAYQALLKVPYEPAYDLYSALAGIWIVHMISSCYVGARDYAFGYMDEYLYPFYVQERENGTSNQEIAELFAGFFVKTNEICGRCTHNYMLKPVLSQSSKQYVLLGGGKANELSKVILEAGKINNMAQPEFTVILSKESSEEFKDKVFEAMAYLTDKLQVYNYELLYTFLKNKGLPEEIATRPAYSACCTFDLNYHSIREEFYIPTVQIFCNTLYNNEFSTKEEFLQAFKKDLTNECSAQIIENRNYMKDLSFYKAFVMDTLLLANCNETCSYPPHNLKHRIKNIFLPGLATLGNSLAILDQMVFSCKKMSYAEFIKMLKADFVGYENIHNEILAMTKFGNDEQIDTYATEMANLLIDAAEDSDCLSNEILVPAFYSLERDNLWAPQIPATPDGRKAGTPFSENQSPTYGTDKNGITALLNSLSKIPFYRTAAGGLNLTFTSNVKPNILKSLVSTYFSDGGLHVGMTVLDRETLKDAMKNPEKYKTLTVRLYGFSQYFISLPEWQQIAVLNRTAH